MSYGKIFSSCFNGSMVGAGPDVFAVWAYVIANTVQEQVELNPTILAAVIGCDKSRMVEAIDRLCQPDPSSRNKDEDGRRLVKEGQFAYRVVSHFIYRSMKDEDERREYNRIKQREHRAKQAVTEDVKTGKDLSRQAEAEAEAEKKKRATLKTFNSEPKKKEETVSKLEVVVTDKPDWSFQGVELPECFRTHNCVQAITQWLEHKREMKTPYTTQGLKNTFSRWSKQFTAANLPSTIEYCISNGWKGLYKERTEIISATNTRLSQERRIIENLNDVHGPAKISRDTLSLMCQDAGQYRGTMEFMLKCQVCYDNGAIFGGERHGWIPVVPKEPLPEGFVPVVAEEAIKQQDDYLDAQEEAILKKSRK